MKKVLVTGATGCIGRATIAGALERGVAVRAMTRRRPTDLPPEAEIASGRVEDPEAVARAMDGCDAVVHLATALDHAPRTPEGEEELRRSIVDGTRVVTEAAAARGARLVSASTISVYAKSLDAEYDEDTAPGPESLYGRAKLDAERVAAEAHPAPLIARIAPVYGPHARGNVQTLVRAMQVRLAVQIGDGGNRNSLVYAGNVADRLLLALERGVAGTFIVADAAPSQRELMAAIATALGRRPPPALPIAPVLAGASVLARIETAVGRPPLWSTRARRLASSMVFHGERLDRALDYTARVSLEEGIARTVAWMRSST